MPRELWETLLELVDAVRPDTEMQGLIHITGLTLDLPVEIGMRRNSRDVVILADLPRWRWKTDFDQQPGRMRVSFMKGQINE